MTREPRVALFCETFHEINGVALTARQLVAFAQRHNRPFLAVHGGRNPGITVEGSVRRVELRRAWLSVPIESDLEYDLFFWRYALLIYRELLAFRPDVIHITSPGELGQLGVILSHLMGIPLVASWHTNFHQFAARRLTRLLAFLPKPVSRPTVGWSENRSLDILLFFYSFAKVTLAPTKAQVRWLRKILKRPSFLMLRGVDCVLFNPAKRDVHDGLPRLGFVGRITPEKGVRLFARIEKQLEANGIHDFQIVMVGAGSEVGWLKHNLRHCDFAGVLRGEDLARTYANMDLFVFPSKTDTFGNVIQEAAASGVASVVTNEGGPKHLVEHGVTGYVAGNDDEFVARVVELCGNRELLRRMGEAARKRVLHVSWDTAFEMTYEAYRYCLPSAGETGGVNKTIHASKAVSGKSS